jgi:hypothetical protein
LLVATLISFAVLLRVQSPHVRVDRGWHDRAASDLRALSRYGVVDAFNPLTGWYDPDALGVDLGITTLKAENARSEFVWHAF